MQQNCTVIPVLEVNSAEPVITPGAVIAVTASAGVAEAGAHTENYDQLMSHADDALYAAK